MQIVLVGADLEENLGMGAIAAACELTAHRVKVHAFSNADRIGELVQRVISDAPDVVGLSIQFQHRAHDFMLLSRLLRSQGYQGHITCGGQFPTMAFREVLQNPNGVDSVVMHDGEQTIVELLEALQSGSALESVAGLAIRDQTGAASCTPPRSLVEDLDQLPVPRRYRPHAIHAGIPFIPIMSSRGCWGACAFCSISSFYRDARARGGGHLFRLRSPEHVAAEMALLWHAAGGKGVFCFHDDNLLLPRPQATLKRLGAIRASLDRFGVGRIGIIGKCRPETLTPTLARELRDLGVVRLYVGVENTSERGARHLNRAIQGRSVRQALAACREAGIFCCYNLLIFEPDTTIDDVAQNVAFIREHAAHPVNFCRAEAYHSTPLHRRLRSAGNLTGSYLGFDYRIHDDRAELLFRICAAAFRHRNFATDGVHNRYMGVGYEAKLLEHFYEDRGGARGQLMSDAERLTRSIALETADFLEEALALAREADLADREHIERETALLGLRIAEADAIRHVELDRCYEAMADYAEHMRQPPFIREGRAALAAVARQLTQGMALGSCIVAAAGFQGCADSTTTTIVDPAPPPIDGSVGPGGDPPPRDAMVVDPVPDPPPRDAMVIDPVPDPPPPPRDAMVVDPVPDPLPRDAMVVDMVPVDAGVDGQTVVVIDMVPLDASVDGGTVVDPPPPDGMVIDMVPPDAGRDTGPPPADPLPFDAALDTLDRIEMGPPLLDGLLPVPGETQQRRRQRTPHGVGAGLGADALAASDAAGREQPPSLDKWVDTSPRRALRSTDLPLSNPPTVSLEAVRLQEGIEVSIQGGPQAIGTRWQAEGRIQGDGRCVTWFPASSDDQISVAVRSRGGVAVTALRAMHVA